MELELSSISQSLVFFGYSKAFRCTCVPWPTAKEYAFFLVLIYPPPCVFCLQVMNSTQRDRRALRDWVSVRAVLERIAHSCLMRARAHWLMSIDSASTPAAVRTAVMDSSLTKMSSMEVRATKSRITKMFLISRTPKKHIRVCVLCRLCDVWPP